MRTRAPEVTGAAPRRTKLLLLGALFALGCNTTSDPYCAESEPVQPKKTEAASASDTGLNDRVGGQPQVALAAPGAETPPIIVAVAGVGFERTINIEAVHGSFDEPVALAASAKPGSVADALPSEGVPSPPQKYVVPLTLSDAYSGGDEGAPLKILDASTGQPVKAVELAAGQYAYVRLVGRGLSREASYRASLAIAGAEPTIYSLRISSTKPHPPLGLRASKWADTFADVGLFQQRRIRLTLPVDAPHAAQAPYHVAVRPSTDSSDPSGEVRPLPACGITALPSTRDGLITVQLPPLDPGRYTGVIEIQGEPLAVDITLKNPFWWVWLLVATGAALSLGLREYMRYRTAREQAEMAIVTKERELEKVTDTLLVWDELCVRNQLRLARGRKGYLALDDVAGILADAVPRIRPERDEIAQALSHKALPSPLRADLRARFARLSYLSSREDAAEVDRGLAELAQKARDGFQTELLAWLGSLKEKVARVEAKILASLRERKAADDDVGAKRIKTALYVIGILVEDARTLAIESELSAGQAEVLSKIEPALSVLAEKARTADSASDIVPFIHCDFRKAGNIAEKALAPPPHGLRIRARGADRILNANEEITFELVSREGSIENAAPFMPERTFIEWWIDGNLLLAGGSRLTYIFQNAGWMGFRKRRLEARVDGHVIATWHGAILRPELSIAVYERAWALSARTAATFVGVLVTGAAAVGILWSNKAFGGWGDYITAALTGLGADLTFVAGGGKLLDNVLQAITGRARREGP